ncbi:MAG: hypothetical protein ACYDCQ_10285 [Dehalococcoidia bacterium]
MALRWLLIRAPRGAFATQALLCTDRTLAPAPIRTWFVQRWQLEVTFEAVRRHLGVETQRQWSDLAIRRTTPALFGRFSLVTVLTHHATASTALPVRQAAWYRKAHPTCADALAGVRRDLWQHLAFCPSDPDTELIKVPRILVERLTETLAYVA